MFNCNINAAIKLQCAYNDAIRTLFAQCTLPKYRDLSTNNMRRYWSGILMWQYYYHYPKSVCIFLWIQCTKSSMELVWKYGRLSSIPFLKSSIPFWHLPYFIPKFPFHSIFHSIPYHALVVDSILLLLLQHFTPTVVVSWKLKIATFYPNGCSQL